VRQAERAGGQAPRSGARQMSLARVLGEKVPLVALSIAVSVVTIVAQRNTGAVASLDVLSLATRVENALVSCDVYLAKMIWPSRLAVLYPHPLVVPVWQAAVAALTLAAISMLVLRAARRFPYLLVGWLWYLVALLPVLGLIQAGAQSRADRYTYVPMVGIAIMAAWGLADLVRGARAMRRALAVAACIALSIYGVLAWQQVQHWRNSESLFRRAVAMTTGNYAAHTFLGRALRREGRIEEAIAQFREAIRIAPQFARAHDALGEVLLADQRAGEALPRLAEAVRLSPTSAVFHLNLAAALNTLGRVDEAAAAYRETLRLSPDSAAAHSGLSAALVEQGRFEQALGELDEAIRLDPGYAPAHYNLGALLLRMGRGGEAVAEFTVATRLNPDDAVVRSSLGTALLSAGRTEEAIAQFSEAIRLRPDLPQLRDNLDLALTQRRNEGKP